MKENSAINPEDRNVEPPKFIVIEGPIGVGKTTLAKRMAEVFNYQTLLEHPDGNPFLEKFYHNPKQHAFATQLFFLFQRAQQLQGLKQDDLFEPVQIADFMIEKDRMFAETILNEDEFKLYDLVFHQLNIEAPKPDLVIYLQAPSHTLLQRIQQRGNDSEQFINAQYLEQINEAYSRFFHYYDDAPLLIINAAQIDLIHDEYAFNSLISYVLSIQNGRHYFNPSFFSEANT